MNTGVKIDVLIDHVDDALEIFVICCDSSCSILSFIIVYHPAYHVYWCHQNLLLLTFMQYISRTSVFITLCFNHFGQKRYLAICRHIPWCKTWHGKSAWIACLISCCFHSFYSLFYKMCMEFLIKRLPFPAILTLRFVQLTNHSAIGFSAYPVIVFIK